MDFYKNIIKYIVLVILLYFVVVFCGSFTKLRIFKKIRFGRELASSKQIILTVEKEKYLNKQLNIFLHKLKNDFLKQQIKELPKLQDKEIVVILNDKRNKQAIIDIVKQLDNNLKVTENKNVLKIFFVENYLKNVENTVNNTNINILTPRLKKYNLQDFTVVLNTDSQIVVSFPIVNNLRNIKQVLTRIGKVDFLFFKNTTQMTNFLQRFLKKEYVDFNEYSVFKNTDFKDAKVVYDNNNKPNINYVLNNNKTKLLKDIAKNNIGKAILIIVDNELVSVQKIQAEILNGKAKIDGNFSSQEAKNITLFMQTPALIAENIILNENTQLPTISNANKIILICCFAVVFAFLIISCVLNKQFFAKILLTFVINCISLYSLMVLSSIVITCKILAIIAVMLFYNCLNIVLNIKSKNHNKKDIFNKKQKNKITLNIKLSGFIILLIVYCISNNIMVKNIVIVLVFGIIANYFSNICYDNIGYFLYKQK